MWKKKTARSQGFKEKTFSGILSSIILLFFIASTTWGALPNRKMNYHDYDETKLAMENLAADNENLVTLKTIGFSYDIPETPTAQTPGPVAAYDILALRIGPVGYQEFQDDGDNIPSILFVGGIHGREWLSTESLLHLAHYLVERLQHRDSDEYALLRRVAVWIIPMVNAAGRIIDDEGAGDPEDFYVGSTGSTVNGWRHNADRRGCKAATDIARNFSYDWGGHSDKGCDGDGWHKHFEGLAPFSTHEATALREFVQNHWICMAVDIHTWTQLIWNIWGGGDLAGVMMKDTAAEIWEEGLGELAAQIWDVPRPGPLYGIRLRQWKTTIRGFVDGYSLLDYKQTGTSSGQFTGWLAQEPRIQSFIIELPPDYNNHAKLNDLTNLYQDTTTDEGKEFRLDANDGSNAWHPSSSRVKNLAWDCFIPMAMYLIGQANAPGSATRVEIVPAVNNSAGAVYTSVNGGSPRHDYGILAAKIGASGKPGAPGKLLSRPAHLIYDYKNSSWNVEEQAHDYLPYGYGYELQYWVQSYTGGLSSSSVELELRSRLHGSADTDPWTIDNTETRVYQLQELEKAFDSFSIRLVANTDYELSIKVGPSIQRGMSRTTDEFSQNDEKVFRFTTYDGAPTGPPPPPILN
jgi:hypothetical protein